MYRLNVIILTATLLVILGVALAVPFIMNPGPEIVVGIKQGPVLSDLDGIPDRIFPQLGEISPPLYVFWREVCHMIVTCLLIGISYFFYYHGNSYAPLVFFLPLVAWITYQESYLHPIIYNQTLWNGVLDWVVWIVPFGVFVYLINQKTLKES